MLRMSLSTADAVILETETITAGRRGLVCGFTFNAAWDGLAKTAVVNGVVRRDVVLVDDSVIIPGECLATPNYVLKIGVCGKDGSGNIVVPTVWANFGKIQDSAQPSDIDPDEVTPDVVAQIQQNSSDALALAQELLHRADTGEFNGRDGATGPRGRDGRDGRDGTDGVNGVNGTDGTDGVSPTIVTSTITGGHRLTITDVNSTTTVDVMDGADGQDAVVDATLSNSGEAADAEATGAGINTARHSADYALSFAENLNNGVGIPLDAEWLANDVSGARAYRVHSKRAVNTEQKVLQAAAGYRFYLRIYSNGSYSDSSWYGPGYSSRKTYTLPKGAEYILVVSTHPEDTSVTADPETYGSQVTIRNTIGSGGGSITVDSALSDTSENPVQNKVIKAALDAKGTYSKPSGGIPASDLASAVQTSLGKADTALQSYTETDPTVPSWAKASSKPSYTASEVGAVAVAQGVAHAGEFVVVGSDGNVTTMTLSTWSAGSY